jgi:hypothetical protein
VLCPLGLCLCLCPSLPPWLNYALKAGARWREKAPGRQPDWQKPPARTALGEESKCSAVAKCCEPCSSRSQQSVSSPWSCVLLESRKMSTGSLTQSWRERSGTASRSVQVCQQWWTPPRNISAIGRCAMKKTNNGMGEHGAPQGQLVWPVRAARDNVWRARPAVTISSPAACLHCTVSALHLLNLVLHCTVQYGTVTVRMVQGTIQYCTAPYSTAQLRGVLLVSTSTVLHCTVLYLLYGTTAYCTVLTALYYSTVQYSTVQYSAALRCAALHCAALVLCSFCIVL